MSKEYGCPIDIKNLILLKRADNVKVIDGVYICPFPASHFSDAQREAREKKYQKFNKKQNKF